MAESNIVGSLFGPTPDQLAKERTLLQQQYLQNAQKVSPYYGAGAGVGQFLGSLFGAVTGMESPEMTKSKKIQSIMKDVNASVTPEEQQNRSLYFKRLSEAFSQDADLQQEALTAGLKGFELSKEEASFDLAKRAKEAELVSTGQQQKINNFQIEQATKEAQGQLAYGALTALRKTKDPEQQSKVWSNAVSGLEKSGVSLEGLQELPWQEREKFLENVIESSKTQSQRIAEAKANEDRNFRLYQMNQDADFKNRQLQIMDQNKDEDRQARLLMASMVAAQKQSQNPLNSPVVNPAGQQVGIYDNKGNFRSASGEVIPSKQMVDYRKEHDAAADLLTKLESINTKDINTAFGRNMDYTTSDFARTLGNMSGGEGVVDAQTRINNLKVGDTLSALQSMKGATSDAEMGRVLSRFPGYNASPKAMHKWKSDAIVATTNFLNKRANRFGGDFEAGGVPSSVYSTKENKIYSRSNYPKMTDQQWSDYASTLSKE